MTVRTAWVFGVLGVLAAACDGADDPVGFGEGNGGLSLRDAQSNGFNLNGFNLNGFNLNGFNLNGFNLNGDQGTTDKIRTTELSYEEDPSPGVWLVGSEIYAEKKNGKVESGTKVKKLKMYYDVTEGGVTVAKTVSILGASKLSGTDIWVYDADYRVAAGPWAPLCVDGAGDRTQMILLSDVWNPATGDRRDVSDDSVTAACRGAALAKCVEWGYRPWSSASGVSLSDYHQACTRMVRADYCGDGVSHTVNGTPIHVLDQLGIQNVDPNVTYAVEAEWGPDGAVCLNSANTRLPNQTLSCQLPTCGGSFTSGGILQSGKVLTGP